MLIDTHTHWQLQSNSEQSEFVSILDENQIDHAIVTAWEPLKNIGLISEWNTQLAEFCAKRPDKFTGLATVHLAEGKTAIIEANRSIRELKLRGFKVHPWMQGEYVFQDTMYDLCRLSADYDVPLMFHDGTPPYAMSCQIGILAQMFPSTKFVLGHGGILHFWEEAIDVVLNCPNVYITLCGQHLQAMQKVCDMVSLTRILFGTDLIGLSNKSIVSYRIDLFENLVLDEKDYYRISCKNALDLYKIERSMLSAKANY